MDLAVMSNTLAAAREPTQLELDMVRLDLGDCLLRLKRFDEALSCFELCISIGAREPALFGKAVALQGLGRLVEAEIAYESLLAQDPGIEEALANLIAINVESFRLPRIEAYSRRLLEMNPLSAVALRGLALVFIERRDFRNAANCLARLSKAMPDAPAEGQDGFPLEGIKYRLRPKEVESLREVLRVEEVPRD
jgi:tetratricopeptide (TPR) repeat protein